MSSKSYKLGDLITEYDEVNKNGEFNDISSLQGINNNKCFQECKSNKNDIDLTRYKICRKGMFAYNRATSRNGEKISIALREGDDCLISPSYYCFQIYRKDIILPEYLLLFFKQPIFDKYARFNSWGSATEFFSFNDFCMTSIQVPSMEKQKSIVKKYKIIEERIRILKKINELLEQKSLYLYNYFFVEFGKSKGKIPNNWSVVKISDVANVTRGASPRPIDDYMSENGMPWVKIADATSSVSKYIRKTEGFIIDEGVEHSRIVEKGTMIVSNSASPGLPMIMDIRACVHDGWLIIKDFNLVSQEYMYYHILSQRKKLIASSNGSIFNNLKTDIVKNHTIVVPDSNTMDEITKYFKKVNGIIYNNSMEIEKLEELSCNLINR